MATPHATLTALAEQTAAQIGFTPRRWWREKTDSPVLHVEVERRIVGAPPAIAVLTVTIPFPLPTQHTRQAPALPASRSQPTKRATRRTTATQRKAQPQKA
jgi:hypothetical protein